MIARDPRNRCLWSQRIPERRRDASRRPSGYLLNPRGRGLRHTHLREGSEGKLQPLGGFMGEGGSPRKQHALALALLGRIRDGDSADQACV